ncbi:hypothetical protein AB0P40_41695, partial [Streptomyces sp. NPDC079189]|uniref:hypothetical protein n=1 Tax=Streptomyces sp. NPDC079189 TaxID=3154514 RepID=UPI0034224F82
ELACVNLVRPDGDLVVAAFAGNSAAEALITGIGRSIRETNTLRTPGTGLSAHSAHSMRLANT